MAAEAEIEEEVVPVKAKPNRRLLGMVAAALIVMGGGIGSYFLFFAANKDADSQLAAVPETFIFNLPPMMVNLNTGGGSEQFMKLTIALEVANEQVMLDIQPRLARVVDAFQVYLRELRKSDLEGSAGIYRLKEELRRRVNVAVFPAQVENILFREILVQ
jgi:flagellar protein FliL